MISKMYFSFIKLSRPSVVHSTNYLWTLLHVESFDTLQTFNKLLKSFQSFIICALYRFILLFSHSWTERVRSCSSAIEQTIALCIQLFIQFCHLLIMLFSLSSNGHQRAPSQGKKVREPTKSCKVNSPLANSTSPKVWKHNALRCVALRCVALRCLIPLNGNLMWNGCWGTRYVPKSCGFGVSFV